MDEIWQRHKTFIVQCGIGGIAFLIAFFVMTSSYSDIEQIQASNKQNFDKLAKRVRDREVPDPNSILAQKAKAEDARKQIEKMLRDVASTAQGEAYVRENIQWVLTTIGRPAADTERFLALYRQLPGAALTGVREEARSVLVSLAAQRGRQIDESFGLVGGVEDDEVPGALHALAIVCDVVRRSLELERIHLVSDVRVAPRNVLDKNLDWVSGVEVRMSVSGYPDDVNALLRGFNEPDPVMSRMTIVKEIESISRKSPDDDTVKASFALLGLRGKPD